MYVHTEGRARAHAAQQNRSRAAGFPGGRIIEGVGTERVQGAQGLRAQGDEKAARLVRLCSRGARPERGEGGEHDTPHGGEKWPHQSECLTPETTI